MEKLLEAIKTLLSSKYYELKLKKDKSVFITPAINWLPVGVRPPCIGIKDGGSFRKELPGGCLEIVRKVHIVTTVDLFKGEQKIIGNNDKDKPGVLDIADAINAELDENLLDLDGYISAFCNEISESISYGDVEKDVFYQQIVLTFDYEWQGER